MTTAAIQIKRRWGEAMADGIHSITDLFKTWQFWAGVILYPIAMSAIISGSVKDAVIRENQNQIQYIREQNERSIQDRQWLHDELRKSQEALRRLERTVKTGEYP